MKNLSILLLFIIPLSSLAQMTFDLKGVTNKKLNGVPKGTNLTLKEIRKVTDGTKAVIQMTTGARIIDLRELEMISFSPTNSREFWQNQVIKHKVYENIVRNGMQYSLRNEAEEESIDFINYVENNNMLFRDSYLESYLYALAYKIYPSRLDDGRPGILNIRIMKNIDPNAFILPNGTMFINTGLLSTINSEEELISILAHEISHFVLDHYVININKETQRQKRADFWAAFATGVAAVADVYLATSNEYYTPGILTASTAVIAFSIAADVKKRMGLKYSQLQEYEADEAATEAMSYIGIDPGALASALSKIKKHAILTGNYISLTGQGSHPSLSTRINKIGSFSTYNDPEYDKKISLINTYNASVQFGNHHLEASLELATRNISANVATEDDYLIVAMNTMYMYDNDLKNNEVLKYIQKAKSLNVYPNLNISKQEAIILIRLRKNEEAGQSLENYLEGLEKEIEKLDKIKNPTTWSYVNNYLIKEYEWTAKMINKVKLL